MVFTGPGWFQKHGILGVCLFGVPSQSPSILARPRHEQGGLLGLSEPGSPERPHEGLFCVGAVWDPARCALVGTWYVCYVLAHDLRPFVINNPPYDMGHMFQNHISLSRGSQGLPWPSDWISCLLWVRGGIGRMLEQICRICWILETPAA